MRISTYGSNASDIRIKVDRETMTEHPFVVYLSVMDYVALTHAEASLLHLQLTAALYEYEEKS